MKFLISGNFLGKPIVGLTRKAYEYLQQVNGFAKEFDIALIVPEELKQYTKPFNNLKVIVEGKNTKGWNSNVAMKYAQKNNMCYVNFTSPLATIHNAVTSMDDIRYMEKYQGQYYDDLKFRIKLGFMAKVGTSKARKILTVSEFSRNRISNVFHVNKDKIEVIPNGWEHLENITPDMSIFEKYPSIEKGNYYYTLGSLAKHKNHKLISKLAENNRQNQFVITGGIDPEIFSEGSNIESNDNLIFTGKLSDEAVKALMMNCKAFIFPSLYEGFGIPPLEALSCGAQVICSDIPVLKEVFSTSVHYIGIEEYDVDLDSLLEELVDSPEEVLKKYSWKVAGEKLYNLFSELSK